MEVRVRVDNLVDDYLEKGDTSNENANMGITPNGLLFAVGGEALGRDYLKRIKEAGFEELANLHDSGGVHIHDLSLGYITPYCVGLSLPNLLADGLSCGHITSKPAKHFRSAINHIVNFIGSSSNEFAGAQALNDIDIYLAPYAKKCYEDFICWGIPPNNAKKLTKVEVTQSIQELLFHLNYNNRFGGQTPFSNITLAITCPPDLVGKPAIIDDMEYGTYDELNEWQTVVANAVLDGFLEGDANGNGFTFPVLTINVTEEFFTHPIRVKIFELAGKFGTPYFQNFINGVSGGERITPEDVRSMCCRLTIREDEIRKHVGGLFGNAEQTGSLQVITLSLPYFAQKAVEAGYGEDKFMDDIFEVMLLCKDEMLWKRQILEEMFENNLFPMTKNHLRRGFSTFFTTIGFIGLWEAVEILTHNEDSFLDKDGMELAKTILHWMKEVVEEFVQDTGKLFNLEATPAESATYKLAKKAIKQFPTIPHRGTKKEPYFTNSCHLPVEFQDDLYLIFDTQRELQPIPNGGTVTHFFCGEVLSPEQVEQFVKKVCQTEIPYFSLTTIYSMCVKHGRITGAHEYCPHCTAEDARELLLTHPELVEL